MAFKSKEEQQRKSEMQQICLRLVPAGTDDIAASFASQMEKRDGDKVKMGAESTQQMKE